jgi:hypothetical protein
MRFQYLWFLFRNDDYFGILRNLDVINIKNVITKTSKLCLCVASICYLTTGCSLIDSDKERESPKEIKSNLDYYTNLEPELKRVLALESDMQVIIAELVKYSNLASVPLTDNTQVQVGALQPVTEFAESDSMQVEQRDGGDAKPSGNINVNIGIHIAAFSDNQHVLPGWRYLKKLLPNGLKNKRPLSSTIHINDNTYYSLRLGPFTSVIKAKKACDRVFEKINDCSITEYRGKFIVL